MQREVFTADFATLRTAYLEVKTFLEGEAWDNEIVTLKTTVEGDLGWTGDDSYEVLDKFIKKYGLKYGDFDFDEHFLSETEASNPIAFTLSIILIPVWIVEKLSFGKLRIYPTKIFKNFYRTTKDLTLRDMVKWYLTKTYTSAQDLSIKLSHN